MISRKNLLVITVSCSLSSLALGGKDSNSSSIERHLKRALSKIISEEKQDLITNGVILATGTVLATTMFGKRPSKIAQSPVRAKNGTQIGWSIEDRTQIERSIDEACEVMDVLAGLYNEGAFNDFLELNHSMNYKSLISSPLLEKLEVENNQYVSWPSLKEAGFKLNINLYEYAKGGYTLPKFARKQKRRYQIKSDEEAIKTAILFFLKRSLDSIENRAKCGSGSMTGSVGETTLVGLHKALEPIKKDD